MRVYVYVHVYACTCECVGLQVCLCVFASVCVWGVEYYVRVCEYLYI